MAWKTALVLFLCSCAQPYKSIEVCDIDMSLGVLKCSDGIKRTARSLIEADGYHCFADSELLKIADRLQECSE